jgi:hypothetical protein
LPDSWFGLSVCRRQAEYALCRPIRRDRPAKRNHEFESNPLPLSSLAFSLSQWRSARKLDFAAQNLDGSFELDGQIYLLESKWEKCHLPEADLLVFRGKIEGKSTFTRGVFIALNDISTQALDAITRGKAASFFVVNGYDLMMILNEAMSLTESVCVSSQKRAAYPLLSQNSHEPTMVSLQVQAACKLTSLISACGNSSGTSSPSALKTQ